MERYRPETVPVTMFTQNELRKMGRVPAGEPAAVVVYPEHKKEYNLYEIPNSRDTKKRSGFSLVKKDWTVEQILEQRKRALQVRDNQNL